MLSNWYGKSNRLNTLQLKVVGVVHHQAGLYTYPQVMLVLLANPESSQYLQAQVLLVQVEASVLLQEALQME